ncbi:hypothetical protein J4Q44_G00013640 [Coregonus suidteri]|uniref:Uncharacterized protein n=1 Tax=Coregonus suidteri TaxID=861788 RepID=A0AAN8NK25_9TELE
MAWGPALILGGVVANLCVCGALLRPYHSERRRGGSWSSPVGHRVWIWGESSGGEHVRGTTGDQPTTNNSRRCFCFQSMQEYCFLLMPDFLMLAVSFLCPSQRLQPCPSSTWFVRTGCGREATSRPPILMSILGVIDIVGEHHLRLARRQEGRPKCLKKYRNVCYMIAVGMEGLCCLFIPLLRTFALLVPFSVLLCPPIGGWLVDTTATYTAPSSLSGFALISSSLVISTVTGIRHCRRTQKHRNKNKKHRPQTGALPIRLLHSLN